VHPRIRERWLAQARVNCGPQAKAGSVVIPLLFETDAAPLFDSIGARPVRRHPSGNVGGARLEGGEIEQRIQAQWPIEKKLTLAHYVCRLDRSRSGLLAHKSIGLSPPGSR